MGIPGADSARLPPWVMPASHFHGWATGAPSVAEEAKPGSSCQGTCGLTIKELGLQLFVLSLCNFYVRFRNALVPNVLVHSSLVV